MFFKTVVLDRMGLVDLDLSPLIPFCHFIYCLVCTLVCICSFIDIDTTARGNGFEFGIYIFITSDFFNNTK